MTSPGDKLFAVIRCGMELEEPQIQLSLTECGEILRFAARQSILPIVYRGLVRLNTPKEYLVEYDNAHMKNIYGYFQIDEALSQISAALDEAHIPYIPLKGATLRSLYPKPGMRISCDLDVLVHESDVGRAVRVIEENTQLVTRSHDYHDVLMVGLGIHLELHFNLKENNERLDAILTKAWKYAEPTGKGSENAFMPEFLIFHVIAHMVHHFTHSGIGIRPFIDLWLLRNRTQFDEEKLRLMLNECGVLRFYEECCRLSEVWLGKAEHTETTLMLEKACLSGGLYGSHKLSSAVRQHKQKGWRYIFSRVFPSEYEVKQYYKDNHDPGHSTAFYYAKRLKSWFSKDRRADLKYQIAAILSSDKETVDEMAELLERLEL